MKNKSVNKIGVFINIVLEKYESLPSILKMRVFRDVIGVAISIVVGILLPCISKVLITCIPFVIFAFVCGYSAYSLMTKDFMIIEGNCTEVLLSPMKVTGQKIYFMTEGKRVCFTVKEKYKKIQKGDYIKLYMNPESEVIQEDGGYTIGNYIAMEITSVATDDESEKKDSKLKLFK